MIWKDGQSDGQRKEKDRLWKCSPSGFRIRIRFSNFSGSGSGFSLGHGAKKECRKVSKSYLLEENLKFMTKDR